MSACANLIIDPFASLFLGMVACLLTMIYDKYGEKVFFKGEPEYILLFSLLSAILSGVFAAGRSSRSPSLSSDTYKLGGLQIASMVVSLCFGVIFGLITFLSLKLTKGVKDNEIAQDTAFWIVIPDSVPLYTNDKYVKCMSVNR